MLMRVTDRLEMYLLDWRDLMLEGELGRGYPSKAIGMAGGWASQEFDDMVAQEDRRIAKVTKTVIEDLPANQQCALHHEYLHAAFRFRDFKATLEAARDGVRAGLKRKGIWMGEA